jgi:hypothetical protein
MLVGFFLRDIVNSLTMHTNSFSVLELHITNGTNSIGGQFDIRMTIIEVAFEISVRT